MKKLATLLMTSALIILPLMFSSCDGENAPWRKAFVKYQLARNEYFKQFGAFGTDEVSTRNWFFANFRDANEADYQEFAQRIVNDILNIDKVLDAYFDNNSGFGTFGTDQAEARQWFFKNYEYAIENDFVYFWQEALKDIQRSKTRMAAILSGAAWRGNIKMNFKNNPNDQYSQTAADEELDFDLAQTGGTYGRGEEKRTNMSDGSADNQNRFNWEIDNRGNIIFDFDDAQLGQGKGVEMVIFYKDLIVLEDKNFKGRMTCNTQNLYEYDDFELVRSSYIKPADGVSRSISSAASRIFSGKNTKLHKLPEMRILHNFSSPRR